MAYTKLNSNNRWWKAASKMEDEEVAESWEEAADSGQMCVRVAGVVFGLEQLWWPG
jgi:hypothetical protein